MCTAWLPGFRLFRCSYWHFSEACRWLPPWLWKQESATSQRMQERLKKAVWSNIRATLASQSMRNLDSKPTSWPIDCTWGKKRHIWFAKLLPQHTSNINKIFNLTVGLYVQSCRILGEHVIHSPHKVDSQTEINISFCDPPLPLYLPQICAHPTEMCTKVRDHPFCPAPKLFLQFVNLSDSAKCINTKHTEILLLI